MTVFATAIVLTKLIILGLTILFVPTAIYLATKGGFYDSDRYHGNGSAH